MKVSWNFVAVFLLMFAIQACQTHSIEPKGNIISSTNGKELILNGRVSLPLSNDYEKLFLDDYSAIIAAPDYRVVYRWIDKDEVEFIGSDKSPYDFFKGALTNPTSEEEERFLEGLNSEVHQSVSSSGNLEYYWFDNGEGQQVYILSPTLSFALEVTYKGQGSMFVDVIIEKSKLL
ncbi:hypothetical protein SG34_023085 [Thalassomonas viridans]|uniref:Lipoprotein n=1 Tax=Thalassomonas viridans TaxID=137584 RepID=A0AAF0C8T7_9GAMM|nr:hypothetical protein [Thalassomonas viridans]WDE04199.1 hypothetical protein SG34_023085 [Thalassomonas viridans]